MTKDILLPPSREQLAQEKDVKVISYRNHHHSYEANDTSITYVDRFDKLTPLIRFIQWTFSFVMVHYFWWILFLAIKLYVWYATGYWYISVLLIAAYLPSFLDGSSFKLGRPWDSARRHWLWELTLRYLQAEIVRTHKLDPQKKYIFALYPHGILILSRVFAYGGAFEALFPELEWRCLAASPMFFVPGSREICLWMNAIDANKKTAQKALKKVNLVVYPGGSEEIFHTDPNSTKTVLIGRKGFIRLAIQNGVSLVPSFVFGEKWIYHRRPVPKMIKDFFMRTLKLPLIFFWGRLGTFLPFHTPQGMSIVYGKPIDTVQNEHPTDEEVDKVYQEYMDQMRHLFDTYKERYGYSADETLEIIHRDDHKKKKHHQSADQQGTQPSHSKAE